MSLLLENFCSQDKMIRDNRELVQDEVVRRQICNEEAHWWTLKRIEWLLIRIARFVRLRFICQSWREADLELCDISMR